MKLTRRDVIKAQAAATAATVAGISLPASASNIITCLLYTSPSPRDS